MSHLFLLQPRQVWLTPVQGLCTVTHGLLAVCECQTLHATRAAIKIEYGLQLSMTYSSGDSNTVSPITCHQAALADKALWKQI